MGVTAQDVTFREYTSTSDVAEQSGSLNRMDRPSLAKSFLTRGNYFAILTMKGSVTL